MVTVACVALALDAAAGDTEVWPLYILAFVSGVGNAYAAPAVGPLLAAGVSQRSLARAVAVLISVMQAGMIAGPAIAGLLQVIGSPVPYIFAGVCAAAAVVMVSLVPRRGRPRPRWRTQSDLLRRAGAVPGSSSPHRRCWGRSRST